MKKLTYFDMGCYPVYVGFSQCPKAFAREMKRLSVTAQVPFVNKGASATTHFFHNEGGELTCLICLPVNDRSAAAQAAIVAHEATHCVQEIWSHIGENEPGAEAEAYLVQFITQRSLEAMAEWAEADKS